jgi:hypothetical protein
MGYERARSRACVFVYTNNNYNNNVPIVRPDIQYRVRESSESTPSTVTAIVNGIKKRLLKNEKRNIIALENKQHRVVISFVLAGNVFDVNNNILLEK